MKNEFGLYKMYLDCDRQGELTGIFIERKDFVDYLLKNNIEIYFGEALGKHSEVTCNFTEEPENTIQFITDRPDVISIVQEYGLENGYNPFEYTFQYSLDDTEDENGDSQHFDCLRDYLIFKLGVEPIKVVKQYTLKQLFSLVDGRLSTTMNDVCEILNHVCDCDLMTHHLPVAMDYIIEKDPLWYKLVKGLLLSIEGEIKTNDFLVFMEKIDSEYSEKVFDVPQLKDEFDTTDFGDYMINNSLLLKKMDVK